ncbi:MULTISPECIES: Abi-alpha family protein [Sphingomonas]|uniref:Abi-alpha family protein n=2 Tax=Sphingomonadaceae TaxID=41297 RepID=UPI000F7FA8EB|nr:Abi-alpha family protein [Sphingomonas sp. ABOLF]RSV14621.1 DUF4393 domain-containing protein [Sphingomonas sp. ABOLF]GLK19221.1 hypothetical protein GCM10017606_00470 [Microbacterium terregens]
MVEIKAEFSGPGVEALKEVASGGRGALRRAFGSALTEFGDMLSDQMKLWRFQNLLRIQRKVDRIAAERDFPDALLQALPFGDAMRTLEAASQEDEDDVQELWARLIVKAATAERPSINKLHIELLRSLTPADSALLDLLYPRVAERLFHSKEEVNAYTAEANAKADASWRTFSEEERGVSIQNLHRLRCITATPRFFNANGVLTAFYDRDRRIDAALIDPQRFQEMLSSLLTLIYQASGAVPYAEDQSIPIQYQSPFGVGGLMGSIAVPELSHMLTPLGMEFMKAVTMDRSDPK